MSLENKLSLISDNLKKNPNIDENSNFIRFLITELIYTAVDKSEGVTVVIGENNITEVERYIRNANRTTSIVAQNWDIYNPVKCQNHFLQIGVLQRSVSERMIRSSPHHDENLKEIREKKKKNSIFHISNHKSKEFKNEQDLETYDTLCQHLPIYKGNSLSKSRNYSSALELSLKKTEPKVSKISLFKKLVTIGDESSNFIRRSLGFRDVKEKKKSPSRENLAEARNQQWRQSFQSLVESDNSVSYKDMSFINYDALNEFNYQVRLKPKLGLSVNNNYIGRTQSMREKVSY